MGGGGQGSSRGAVRGHMVVAAEAAYAEGKAGDEAVGWAHLWPVVDSDGKVGFGGGGAHWALVWVPVSAAVGDGVAGGGQRYG